VSLGRAPLATALAAALAAAACTSPPAGPPADLAASALCFREPVLAPPDDAIRARVAALTAAVDEPERSWIRALATHESGGEAGAISPTGCAGPLAIRSCDGCTPCCIADAADRSPRYYDRCDSESRSGYRCDPASDPRFRPGYSVDYAERRLGALRRRLARAPGGGHTFAGALAASWNAGAGVFDRFPEGLAGPPEVIARLAFGAAEPYRAWAPEDLWNKVVEVYDYVAWLDFLAAGWRDGFAPRAAGAAPSERCFAVAAGRLAPAARPAGDWRAVEIARLRFGRYQPDVVEVLPAPGP